MADNLGDSSLRAMQVVIFSLHVREGDVEDEIVAHRPIDFRKRRFRELATFFVLAFGIWPIVAVGVVGGYGFLVWFYQILNGPPGPHGG